MIQQIPFDTIEKPFEYKDIKIKNGYQLHLTEDFDFNEIEVGSCPFYLTMLGHNFMIEPVMIYTFLVGDNNEIFIESEAISSSEWITETNQPELTGFIWPNIDSYFMHGFQPNIIFVLAELTNNKLIDPIMNIRTRTSFE